MNFPRPNDFKTFFELFKPLKVALRNLVADGGDGVVLENTTPATEAEPVQKPPRIRLKGAAWSTDDGESKPVEILIEGVPVTNADGEIEIHLGGGCLVLGDGDASTEGPADPLPAELLAVVDGTSSTPNPSAKPMVTLSRRSSAEGVGGRGIMVHGTFTHEHPDQEAYIEALSFWFRNNGKLNRDYVGLALRMIAEGEPGDVPSFFALWPSIQKSTRVDSSAQEASFNNQYSRSVIAATNTSPIEITTGSGSDPIKHFLQTGDEVYISGVLGNTAANGPLWTITRVDDYKFTLDGSTGNGSFTSGGTVFLHCSRDYGVAGNRGMPLGVFIGGAGSHGNATAILPLGSGDPDNVKAWTGIDMRPNCIAPETKRAGRWPFNTYLTWWREDWTEGDLRVIGVNEDGEVDIASDHQVTNIGGDIKHTQTPGTIGYHNVLGQAATRVFWAHRMQSVLEPIDSGQRIFQFRFSGQHDDETEPFDTTDNLCFVIDVDATGDWSDTDCPAKINIRSRSTIGAALASIFSLTTDGKLTVGGADIVTGYSVRAYRTTGQTIPDNTETLVNFTAEHWDTNDLHDNSTNNSRLKAVVAGTYQINAHVCFVNHATGLRYAYIRVNGTTTYTVQKLYPTAAGGLADWINLSTLIRLAANDYVEVVVFQNSGGDLDIAATGNHCAEFAMARVSA